MKSWIQILIAFALIRAFDFAALAFALTLILLLAATFDRPHKLAATGIVFSLEIILLFSMEMLVIATEVV